MEKGSQVLLESPAALKRRLKSEGRDVDAEKIQLEDAQLERAMHYAEHLMADERKEIEDAIGQPRQLFSWRNRSKSGKDKDKPRMDPKGVFTKREVKLDRDLLDNRKKKHKADYDKLSSQEQKDSDERKRLADTMEAMLTDQVHRIFGRRARTYFTTEYTDLTQGVDAVVVIGDGRHIEQIFSIDFTYATTKGEIAGKLSQGMRGVVNGTLTNPKYLYVPYRSDDGQEIPRWINAQSIPRITMPLDQKRVEEYARLWGDQLYLELENSPVRAQMLDIMIKQLERKKEYAQKSDASLFNSYNRSKTPKPEDLEKQRGDMIAALDAGIDYLKDVRSSVAGDKKVEDKAMNDMLKLLESDAAMGAIYTNAVAVVKDRRKKAEEERAAAAAPAAADEAVPDDVVDAAPTEPPAADTSPRASPIDTVSPPPAGEPPSSPRAKRARRAKAVPTSSDESPPPPPAGGSPEPDPIETDKSGARGTLRRPTKEQREAYLKKIHNVTVGLEAELLERARRRRAARVSGHIDNAAPPVPPPTPLQTPQPQRPPRAGPPPPRHTPHGHVEATPVIPPHVPPVEPSPRPRETPRQRQQREKRERSQASASLRVPNVPGHDHGHGHEPHWLADTSTAPVRGSVTSRVLKGLGFTALGGFAALALAPVIAAIAALFGAFKGIEYAQKNLPKMNDLFKGGGGGGAKHGGGH